MLTKVDHLGVVVRDLDDAMAKYEQLTGLRPEHREVVADQGVEVVKFGVGESAVELISPVDPESAVARYLDKRGEGIHHVCFEVESLDEELARLEEAGVKLIDHKPRLGAGGALVAFVHPSAALGMLTELKQAGSS